MTITRDDHEEKGFSLPEVERLREKIRQLIDREAELRSILEETALSESRFRHIIEDHTDFICRFLPGGVITFANRALCNHVGKPAEELIGENYYTFIPQEDLEKLHEQLSLLTSGNPVFTTVHREFASDGKTRCHQWTCRAIFDRQGQFIEYQAVGRDITLLIKAEDAIRQSEEKHRMVLDNATDGIYKVNCHGYFTYMNSVLLKRYNLRPDNYHTIHFLDLAPPDAHEILRAKFERLMLGKENPPYELSTQTGDGRKISLEIKSRPIFENGKVVEVLGITRDITARKQAEQALRQSEKKYGMMLDSVTDGVYRINPEGYFTYMNSVLLNRYSLSPDDCHTRHFLDIVAPEHRELVRAKFERVMQGEENPPYELTAQTSDGRKIIAEVKSRPIFENGKVAGLLGVSRDITARRQAEEALRRSDENYRVLLGSISDGVYQLDTRGYFSYMNRVSLERTGLTPDNLNSVHFLDIVTPEERERTEENFQRVMRGEEVPPYEVSYLDQEGRKHHVEIRTRPITENGNIVGLVGISRDITARKQSEELLLNAKNLLEQMVDKRTKELEEKAVQLTESEKRYRAIFENTGAATCIIEKDFTVSFLNGEFERLTGYSKEEFEGKIKLTTLIHEEDLPRLKEYHRLRRIDPAAAPRHYDFRMVDRAGRIRDLFATIDLIPGTMKSVASVLDITDRKQMERSLMEREKELQVHSRHLEEMNTALNVLLRKLETEKQSVEAEILTNAKENIIPYLDSIENTALDESQRLCIDAIRKNLSAILSPFVKNMKTRYPGLSSKESQVARLITQGRTTKDIAAILKISPKAVESHRYNIRKKLRISGKRSNLRDFLLKFSDRH